MSKNDEINDSQQGDNLKRHQEAMDYTIELLESMLEESATAEEKTDEA